MVAVAAAVATLPDERGAAAAMEGAAFVCGGRRFVFAAGEAVATPGDRLGRPSGPQFASTINRARSRSSHGQTEVNSVGRRPLVQATDSWRPKG